MLGLTGTTGSLGRLVLDNICQDDDAPFLRLVARDTQKAVSAAPTNLKATKFDSKQCVYSAANQDAFEGVETLFLVSAMESETRLDDHQKVIDAAVKGGVKRIVYTSFYGAAPHAAFHHARDHYHTEEHIKQQGTKWIFIRNNFYQDILPDFVSDGKLRGPAGNGRCSAVQRKDIAAVISTILLAPERFDNRILNLTGPDELSMSEIADTLGCEYVDESEEEAWKSREGAEKWLIDAWISTYRAIKAGECAGVSGDVETVLGRKPGRFEDYIQEVKDKK